ncbi:MAG: 2-C-methyl-D-erythritol 2,4-cyclodiphosphate synthase [Clostridia bacterium]|nr:2-C-methyl-D-erythritol 2,4-cyclodiphosphate synthase [Clostridia bacterium]
MPHLRIGHGYDAHRFCEDRPLILGGVTYYSRPEDK